LNGIFPHQRWWITLPYPTELSYFLWLPLKTYEMGCSDPSEGMRDIKASTPNGEVPHDYFQFGLYAQRRLSSLSIGIKKRDSWSYFVCHLIPSTFISLLVDRSIAGFNAVELKRCLIAYQSSSCFSSHF
jgi:hypothetical protein